MANGKLWTIREVNTLKRFAAEYRTINEVAEELGRTRMAVLKYARKHDIKFKRKKDWSKEEESLLIDLYEKGVYVEAIAKKLNRGKSAIITKASRLGIADRMSKRRVFLTDEDIEDMKVMYEENRVLRDIAEDYGVCESTVVRIMKDAGMKPRRDTGVQATRKDKTIIPFKVLTELYLNKCLSQEEIAETLNLSRNIVRGSLRYHGITMQSVQKRKEQRTRYFK